MPRKTLPKEELKALGALIKRKREERLWTQEDLASKIGAAPNTVTRWETGVSLPTSYAQRKLIKWLHISKNAFSPSAVGEPSGIQDPPLTPPPVKRIYRGWRTGNFKPLKAGERPRYDYEEKDYGAGETHVTVNGYPLDFFNKNEDLPFGFRFDWGHIGQPTDNLAASLLANYFHEPSIPGKKSPERFQTMRYLFSFSDDVVAYLPYEEWELTSDDITAWLTRENARMRAEEREKQKKKK